MMPNKMTDEERQALVDKITAKLPDMEDSELMAIDKQMDEQKMPEMKPMADAPVDVVKPPVIDTKVLTGPVNSLKNFLINKSRDNDAK